MKFPDCVDGSHGSCDIRKQIEKRDSDGKKVLFLDTIRCDCWCHISEEALTPIDLDSLEPDKQNKKARKK